MSGGLWMGSFLGTMVLLPGLAALFAAGQARLPLLPGAILLAVLGFGGLMLYRAHDVSAGQVVAALALTCLPGWLGASLREVMADTYVLMAAVYAVTASCLGLLWIWIALGGSL
ncbi:hypothetical protein [Pseudoponticoccus marisrubri]|uniref:Uncharacterized protein n=1 Tax=Pseudoponticoccus marisrubri TaxID=1685382 RepID=A0A0W7WLY0_9RHOB|nr:hypothetical protein [Pseudoponticoccus marisrubri]KUF11595.1 hypothetical protein AVJ23_07515 [Pseudoponticoccus marisrubri]